MRVISDLAYRLFECAFEANRRGRASFFDTTLGPQGIPAPLPDRNSSGLPAMAKERAPLLLDVLP